MNITGDVLLIINIVIGVLVTFVLFLLRDIKEDLRSLTANVLKHISSFEIHCSRDRFRINHITERTD